MFIGFLVVIEVKDSVDWRLDELRQITRILNTKLIYSPTMSFYYHICCCCIVCNSFNCFINHNSQLARFLTWQILNVLTCVKYLLAKRPRIVDCNRIVSIVSVSEPLVILIWGEGFSPLGLTHCRGQYVIFMAIFGAGALGFNSTLSDQFTYHQ